MTSHTSVLTFKKNLLSNFILGKVSKLYFLVCALIPPVAEPPNLMPPRSARLPLDTKHPEENIKLLGSVGHTSGENPKIHIFALRITNKRVKLTSFNTISEYNIYYYNNGM